MIKSIVKNLLGQTNINYIKSYRSKYLPTKEEREEVAKRRQFFTSLIKPGKLCFDVGANLGNRIQPLLLAGAKVVAVEPQESCYKVLKTMYGHNIELVTKGLGSKEEIKDFYLSNVTVVSSFSKDWIDSVKDRFTSYRWEKTIKVEMTTLDILIKRYGVPAFIKIDVEGYELEVLKGLTSPVRLISFEYTIPEQLHKVIDCIEQVTSVNKRVECNYSIGESMEFALNKWISPQQMIEHVHLATFTNSGFGDLYLRQKE